MGAVPAQKALQESKTKIRELLEVTREKNIFSEKGPMNCPTDKSMIFTKKQKEKDGYSGHTYTLHLAQRKRPLTLTNSLNFFGTTKWFCT